MAHDSVAAWLGANFSGHWRKVLRNGEKGLRDFLAERDQLAYARDPVRKALASLGIREDKEKPGQWVVDSTDGPIITQGIEAALNQYEEMIRVEVEDEVLTRKG